MTKQKERMEERTVVSMDEAIKLLNTTRPTFYRWLRSGKVKGMKAGRQWRFYREDIERFLKGQEPVVDLPVSAKPLIESLKEKIRKAGGKILPQGETRDVQYLVNLIIYLAVCIRASDIHISPFRNEHGKGPTAVIRMRIDGVLHPVGEMDMRLLPPVAEQMKRMAGCDLHETVRPQDGRAWFNVQGKDMDMRLSFLPAVTGESIAARLLSKDIVSMFSLDRMGFSPADKEKIQKNLKKSNGMIIVTGPAGSGKTTFLYTLLHSLANPELKIMTVEDPVELILPWVVQVREKDEPGMRFANILRSFLRQDPDVIMIGEIRDHDTLQIAHQAALTGHLVMTSLHTDDAAGALKRMVDMGSAPFIVGASTILIVAQRLVRKACPGCSLVETPEPDEMRKVEEILSRSGLETTLLSKKFRKAVGCEKCGGTGYRGRMVVAETLEMSRGIADALEKGASVDELREIAVKEGMTTIAADGVQKASNGETTLAEIFSILL